VWFILQLNTAALVTERALGAEVLIALLPSCTLAAVYPFAKRVMPWPQFVLALSLGLAVHPGRVSNTVGPVLVSRPEIITRKVWENLRPDIGKSTTFPLGVAYAAWTIYFDTAYGLQDIDGDRLSGIGSLAQFLGRRWYKYFMIAMNLVVVASLHVAINTAGLSFLVADIALGSWAISIPLQVSMLNPDDPSSGGKVFVFNIFLGLAFTSFLVLEVCVGQYVP
jgi:4-hydroxybenzoate polyprenyltransferase